ncbi:MAG: methyltransferase domain-containing protein [Ginsengibacter sp.]
MGKQQIAASSKYNTRFPNNFFDAVVVVSVLEFVADIEKAVMK